jgi:hypothetical protein
MFGQPPTSIAMRTVFIVLLLFVNFLRAAEPADLRSLKTLLVGEWTEITFSIAAGCDCVGTIQTGIRLTKGADGVALLEYGTFGASEMLGKPARLNGVDTKQVLDGILLHYSAGGELTQQVSAALPRGDRDSLRIVVHVRAAPLNDSWIRVLRDSESVSTWITRMKTLTVLRR